MNSCSAKSSNIVRSGLLLLLSLFTVSILAEEVLPESISSTTNAELPGATISKPTSPDIEPPTATLSEVPSIVAPKSLNSARQVVEKFQEGLIAVMQQAKELGYQGRHDQLKSVVDESHDLAGIARIVVGGKQWKSFDEDQKQQLLAVFSRLAIATYAYNFNDYAGESFQFVSEKEAKRGRQLVRTLLIVPKGEDVRFDCVLKAKDGRWLIVNIIANGVSDLALKRSEYSSILGQQGFDGLLEKMNGKIEYYAGNKKSET